MARGLGVAALFVALTAPAAAQTPTADLLRQATEAERRAAPAEAVRHYRAIVEAEPTSRLAGRARRRLAWLEARSEGAWGPLTAYSRFRDRSPAERTAAVVSAFEAEVRRFPEGVVARESWALIGEAWLALGDPARAGAAFEAVLASPGLEESERVLAHTGLARAIAARDGAAAGVESLERAGLRDTTTHEILSREARRGWARLAALAAVGLFVVAAIAIGRRGLVSRAVAARALSPWRMLAGAHVLLVPWVLAWRYDAETADTFGLVAAGGAVILALASLAGVAAGARGASRVERGALAVLAALAYGALGWLALDRAGPLLSFA